MTQASSLLSGLVDTDVVADRAYDSAALREQLRAQRCRVVIPSNPTRAVQHRYDRKRYKLRHRVENFFQRFKRFRRISTRFEKLATNFLAMSCFVAALTWVL